MRFPAKRFYTTLFLWGYGGITMAHGLTDTERNQIEAKLAAGNPVPSHLIKTALETLDMYAQENTDLEFSLTRAAIRITELVCTFERERAEHEETKPARPGYITIGTDRKGNPVEMPLPALDRKIILMGWDFSNGPDHSVIIHDCRACPVKVDAAREREKATLMEADRGWVERCHRAQLDRAKQAEYEKLWLAERLAELHESPMLCEGPEGCHTMRYWLDKSAAAYSEGDNTK